MSVLMPLAVATYFRPDDRTAEVFAEDAVVKDEGQVFQGREAIRAWRAETTAKYDYVAEPLAAREENGRLLVDSRVTGRFPGSPIVLTYAFVLKDDLIAGLEIA